MGMPRKVLILSLLDFLVNFGVPGLDDTGDGDPDPIAPELKLLNNPSFFLGSSSGMGNSLYFF